MSDTIVRLARKYAPHSVIAIAAIAFLLKRIRIRRSRRSVTHISPDEEFDFVIVGGGTAGCVLAARLSENAHIRVLLVEAGPSNGILESKTPAAFKNIWHGPHDYDLYTEPQKHAANKKKHWPRGRLLGGCSAINALMAQYGSPSDYDEFSSITGDYTWAWKNFERYFRKFENYTSDPRFPHVDASLHGSDGPVTVGFNGHTSKGTNLFVQASVNAGIPFNADFNTSRGTLGTNKHADLFSVTYIDSHGKRVSAESAYLTPRVLARPNLKVLTLTRVTKIIFDSALGVPRAVAVEFATSKEDASRTRARARKEVIVCGGSVHTPQILMLSGVGPSSVLNKHGISVIVDSPGVGANLSDHPVFHMRLGDKLGISVNYLQPYDLMSKLKFITAVAQYKTFGTGPLSSNMGEAVAFFRTDDPRLFPPSAERNNEEDSTSGPDAPDIELIYTPILVRHPSLEPWVHGYTILIILLRPTSVGSIQLKSADPWDDPLIDPNYLATRHDVDVFVRGVRAAYRIAHTAPLTNITDVGARHVALDHNICWLSDTELGDAIKSRVQTLYHPVGTCKMGKDGDPTAVLDTQMSVRGVLGLRVCDASIYPKLVSGHTAGCVYAAAEKLADILKAEYAPAAK